MTTQPPVGPLDSESVKLEDVLFFKLKDLILEQSEGEWTDEMIVRDAHHFANHLRPLFRLPSEAGEGAAEQYNQARRDFNRMRDDGSLSDEPTTPPTDPRLAELEAENAALTKALTGLTCGGSEFFTRKGERYVADVQACVEWVRRTKEGAHKRTVAAVCEAKQSQARLDRAIEALEGGLPLLETLHSTATSTTTRAVVWREIRRTRQALASIRGEA